MAEMVRVNTRISSTLNDWLDNESKTTGVPKSTLVMLALEGYREKRIAMEGMLDMATIVDKLEKIEKQTASGK